MQRFSLFVLIAMLSVVSGVRGGETFKPTDGGFIANWLVLEPISLPDKASSHDEENQKDLFDKEYFAGQKTATPKKDEKVKVGETELTWRAIAAEGDILNLPEVNNSLYIAVTYIHCEEEMSGLSLKIGSDDSSLWLLNGKEVLRVYQGRGVDRDQNTTPEPVTLNKGTNVLMALVINGEGGTGLCARFAKPVKNFEVRSEK
jgi:hypothetical protein